MMFAENFERISIPANYTTQLNEALPAVYGCLLLFTAVLVYNT